MKNQIFRFCCRCIRMTLMKNNVCFFCGGKFVLSGLKDNFGVNKKRKKHEAPH